jgi:hypothetical protein
MEKSFCDYGHDIDNMDGPYSVGLSGGRQSAGRVLQTTRILYSKVVVIEDSIMKKNFTVLRALLVIGLISGAVSAGPTGGDFEITNSTIDNGGGTSSGGEFSLTGTTGQHDASVTSATGGPYRLAGGFWGAGSVGDGIFSDGFEG